MTSNRYSPMDNPSSPVSHLPPELLVRVFGYLTICSSPTILLKTCRRWADIASSVSSLWCRIDFSTPPAPLLQRCASRPIEVILPSSPTIPTSNQLNAAKGVLLLYSDRIRKLVLDLPAGQLRRFEAELSGAFPILADVSISVKLNHYTHLPFDDFPEWTPTAIPFSPIRYLRLLLVKSPWVPGRFQNLVEFFLHDQWCSDFDPSMEIFLGILESSPQLTILSVANAGPRLPLGTTTLPPATRVVHLHNLQHLYIEQQDACDVGWMLIHLKISISVNVRIFVDLDSTGQSAVPPELVVDLALPNHPGFPHLTNLRRCTYVAYILPSCVVAAPNFAFNVSWDAVMHTHFDNFMIPFLRRAMAAGVIEDLTVIHERPDERKISIFQWDQLFSTLHSLKKLRVQQIWGGPDPTIWALFESLPSTALRDLSVCPLVFGKGPQGEEEEWNRKELTERLVNWCAERHRRGCRLNRLVIEDLMYPPPDLTSLLAPYVDHFEIGKVGSGDGDIWGIKFGSRHVFDHLRVCR